MTVRPTPPRPWDARGPWLFDGPPDATPPRRDAGRELPAAVLFDRDGTLVADVPYNGDPERVAPMPAAREAVDAVRRLGIPVGVVSNQSGVARGLLTRRQVEAVRTRVEELLGPFGVWAVCPHGPADGCRCRKPAPGLVVAACARLGVPVERTAVIGDIGADLGAARAAGARGVLVPTAVTRREELAAADLVAPDLLTAVRLLLRPDHDPLRRLRPGGAPRLDGGVPVSDDPDEGVRPPDDRVRGLDEGGPRPDDGGARRPGRPGALPAGGEPR